MTTIDLSSWLIGKGAEFVDAEHERYAIGTRIAYPEALIREVTTFPQIHSVENDNNQYVVGKGWLSYSNGSGHVVAQFFQSFEQALVFSDLARQAPIIAFSTVINAMAINVFWLEKKVSGELLRTYVLLLDHHDVRCDSSQYEKAWNTVHSRIEPDLSHLSEPISRGKWPRP